MSKHVFCPVRKTLPGPKPLRHAVFDNMAYTPVYYFHSILMAGILPFGAMFIELFFIFTVSIPLTIC